jgi:hypothetical protein
MMPVTSVSAGPLDSIPIDPGATTIHPEKTVTVPANGAVGSDIHVSSRAFLSIDFAVQPGKQVTLLVITGAQKREMDAGKQITGRPQVRAPIDGTASQSLTVNQGGYYVAILNSNPQPCPSHIGSAPARSDRAILRSLWALGVIALIACALSFTAGQTFAGPLDSIPVGPSDRILLNQNVNLNENGSASNLFVPQQATVFLDLAVQPGKKVLLMVITEDQWKAISSGEIPSGSRILRTHVSGVDSVSVSIPRGTYAVAMIPAQGTAQVVMRARARY